jgi:RHS repeat-associated protein
VGESNTDRRHVHGHFRQSLYYDNNANVLTIKYPDQSILTNRYDALRRRTNVIDAANKSVSFFYNNQGLLSAASNAFGQVLSRKYDIRDRLTNEVNANGVAITITYDNVDRVLTRSYPDGGVEKFLYSARGLVGYTNQLGFVTRHDIDVLGRKTALTNANSEVLRYAYNPSGDLLALIDGKGQTNSFQHDQYGRLTNNVDATGANILRFKYDAVGRMTNRWTAGKGDTFYSYDQANNLTNINHPVSPDISYAYDAAGRITNMIDAVGSSSFAYTSFGALWTEDGPFSSDTLTNHYTANHLRGAFSVLTTAGTNWQNAFTYDAANRLLTNISWAGSFTYSYQGAGGLVQKIQYDNGCSVTNAYDSVGRLASRKFIGYAGTNLNFDSYVYDLAGQRTKLTRVSTAEVNYTYDPIGQLRTGKAQYPGNPPWARANEQISYVYDAAGNLQSRTNDVTIQTFVSNSRNELTNVTRNSAFTMAGSIGPTPTAVRVNGNLGTHYFDGTFSKGDLTLADGTNTFTVVAEDVNNNRYTTNVITTFLPASVNFTHDANGNLTSDGLRAFEYDDENQLTRITVTNNGRSEFAYDGLRRRRLRTEFVWINGGWATNATVGYIYDSNLVVEERWGGGEPPVYYTRGLDLSGTMQGAGGIGGLLARSQHVNGKLQHNYYFSDGSGNVTTMVNPYQQIVAKYLYAPFGNIIASSGPMADLNLYRFSSKEAHDNSGLVYYGLRFYDPSLQRWLNGDPLREGGGINLQRFCGGDPINAIDPWGLEKDDAAKHVWFTTSATFSMRYGVDYMALEDFRRVQGQITGTAIHGVTGQGEVVDQRWGPNDLADLLIGADSVRRLAAHQEIMRRSAPPPREIIRSRDRDPNTYNALLGGANHLVGTPMGERIADLNGAMISSLLGNRTPSGTAASEALPMTSNTAENVTVYWAGGATARSTAEQFASSSGRNILGGGSASALERSVAAAQNARGGVDVFMPSTGQVRLDSIWINEYNALMANPNVSSITYRMVDDRGNVVSAITQTITR